MLKTNFHTHTTFCDGKGTPEQLAESAIAGGFSILGLSSHSMYPFAGTWHIAPNSHKAYAQAVRSAQEKYRGKLSILLGFEADYAPNISKPDFSVYKSLNPDYLIGSVHYIFSKKGRLAVDYGAEKLKEKIETLFNGNARKMTCEYFSLEREMIKNCNFTILGHADLVRKNNGILNMFNEKDSWYRKEIKATADAIKKAGVIVEINTGAIARGYMNDPYPSDEFLALLHDRGVPVTLSSDCHSIDGLDFAFDRALKAAMKAGYTELAYLDADAKIRSQQID